MTKKICILILSLMLLAAAGCDVPAQAPTASPPTSTDTTNGSDFVGATAGDTATPDPDSSPTAGTDESANPDDTSSANPDDSASPDPDGTASADPSGSPDATQTPDPDETDTATSATPMSGAITVKPINGTAAVESTLTLRATASTAAKSLAVIKKDESFTIKQVSKSTSWLKVEYDGKTGYVLAKYVKLDGESTHVCTVTSTSPLNLRSGAGKNNDIIGGLKSGSTLVVVEQVSTSSGKWYKLTQGDAVGYVDSRYCRISGACKE